MNLNYVVHGHFLPSLVLKGKKDRCCLHQAVGIQGF